MGPRFVGLGSRGLAFGGLAFGGLPLLGLSGCLEFILDPIDPIEPPPQQIAVVEQFVQAPLPRADLLLVIDDTASMVQEQRSLSEDLGVLLDELDGLGVAWQLGVVSTDMVGDEAGWLRGTPWILTPDVVGREEVFADMVQVGTVGAGPEAGLAAAALALSLAEAGGPNAGFRRPDALLSVVFVSDADDHSDDWLGADPSQSFVDVLAEQAAQTGLPARASGVVGPVPSGCTSLTGTAQPAVRYDEVIEASGGVRVSICAVDFAGVLAQLSDTAVVWRTVFALREIPDEGTTRVRIDGAPVTAGWEVAGEPPELRFEVAPEPGVQIEVSYVVTLGAPG